MSENRLITTECVAYGHPDKMADQISDAILDACLAEDSLSRVAVETMIKDQTVVLGGEITTKATVDVESVVRSVIGNIIFTPEHNLAPESIRVINLLGQQSPEIGNAVFMGDGEIGSGDQGMMLGYASNETPNYMPLGMYFARKILNEVITGLSGLGPDAKSQVTVEESLTGKRVHTILVSTVHDRTISLDDVQQDITSFIRSNGMKISDDLYQLIDSNTIIHVNPAGSWYVGGPVSDCGVTGRKIVVDQYGPYCPVGGGCFSGKDPSKTDRSGAYMARYLAKNIVAAGIFNSCTVELAYMIGVSEPVSIRVDGDTDLINSNKLINTIRSLVSLTPKGIIERFDLRKPIYRQLSREGHFGGAMPWEQTDIASKIRDLFFGR